MYSQGVRRYTAVRLALLLLFACAGVVLGLTQAPHPSWADEVYTKSGLSTAPDRSLDALREAYATMPDHPDLDKVWSTNPNLDSYKAGSLSSQSLSFSEAYINFMRTSAGLGPIMLDAVLNNNAAQGGLIMAKNDALEHEPPVPSGVSASQAAPGQYACTNSNISFSYGYSDPLLQVVQGQMDDSGSAGNITNVGHRRWLLNPSTSTMGIGSARSSDGSFYSAVRVLSKSDDFDSSYGQVAHDNSTDYDFIAWPASGYFANNV